MASYPPAPLTLQRNMALHYTHSQIAYVGYEGTVFQLSGPLAPVLGAQSGVVLKSIAHIDPGFKHLDNKGARQDGTTWYDSLYEAAEIDMIVELGGVGPFSSRQVIADWFGAWDPKKLGKLCWFSPEKGEWWCNVRLNKAVPDTFKQDFDISRGASMTWSCRNDDAFWRSVDSVDTFGIGAGHTLSITGAPTGGTYTLTALGVPGSTAPLTTDPIPYNAPAPGVESALAALPGMGGTGAVAGGGGGSAPLPGVPAVSVAPVGGSDSLFNILLQGALALVSIPITLIGDFTSLVGSAVGGILSPTPGATVSVAGDGGASASGHLTLTNFGDQPGWPRYLCYGPGTFSIADGNAGTNMITFGPLEDGQIALLSTLPRLPTVTDLTPGAPSNVTSSTTNNLITNLINFVFNNNLPPLLQDFESVFGVLPPQGPLYSLLSGRFTQPIAPMLAGVPTTASIPCSISGGSSTSKIIASLTPFRRWPA